VQLLRSYSHLPVTAAGAVHTFPETIEARLHLGATALQMLHVPPADINQVLQYVRDLGCQSVLEREAGS
jgi:monovalent cation:H+ antiporter-2, CPA2 family